MSWRIALVLERVRPARGGTEAYAAELATRLTARGHTVTLVSAEVDPAVAARIPVLAVPVPPWPKAARAWAFARRAAATTAGRFDCVHGLQKSLGHDVFQPHTGSHRASLAALRAGRRTPAGRAAHRVGKWLSAKQWVFAAIERRQYTQAPAPCFVAVSDLVLRQMVDGHHVPSGQVVLLPNPVDGARFRPPTAAARAATRDAGGLPAGATLVLFVGHEFGLKGLEPLLHALTRPQAQALHLWVAGRGASPGWRRRTARLGLARRVRFLGPVADAAPFYGAADLLAAPTFYDPAPLATLEALASGLPVVTTEANGHADLVREAGGGVVADPWDAAALAAALGDAADPVRRPARAVAARAVAERHGWEPHLAALEAIYATAIAARAITVGGHR